MNFEGITESAAYVRGDREIVALAGLVHPIFSRISGNASSKTWTPGAVIPGTASVAAACIFSTAYVWAVSTRGRERLSWAQSKGRIS